MSASANPAHQTTAVNFSRCILENRRLAVDVTVAQTRDLAEAIIQQDKTIEFQREKINALCDELDALENIAKGATK